MMERGIESYPFLPWNKREIARYAGCPGDAIPPLLEECLPEAQGAVVSRVAWAVYPVVFTDGGLDLVFAKTASRDLMRNLWGCEKIVLFAATVGPGLDLLAKKYARLSPAKAQLF